MSGSRVTLLFALVSLLGAAVASAEQPTGSDGCLATRGGETIEALRADERRAPASVQKLAVAAAALEHLGSDYRVRTRLDAVGAIRGGALEGDLVLRAAGDPTWSERFFAGGAEEPLDRLVTAVRAAGIRRVRGDLVLDLSRFPGRPAPASRSIGDLAFAFAAPTGGLAVDENALHLRMAPGPRAGTAPSFEVRSGGSKGGEARIVNFATTVPASRHEKGTVDFQARWDDGALVIRGEYPISEPAYDIELAVADGEERAGRRLLRALEAAGVEVEGRVRSSRSALPAGRALGEIVSPPLAAWLPPILGDSHNWLTEMLLRVLAAERLGEGRKRDGLEWLEEFLRRDVGIAPGAVTLDDASGVSPYNLWTPRAVVRLLEWSWSRPWRRVFVEALARPGRGTLRGWPALPPRLVAKTGTLRHTVGLAGYVQRDGAPLVFACLLDHRIESKGEVRLEIARRLWGWQ